MKTFLAHNKIVIKEGNLISFYTCSNADRHLFKGTVKYKDQLGFITVIDGIQYELRKLLDIKKISIENSELENAMNKISKDIFENLEHGEGIQLTENYILYRYTEDNIYVINKVPEWEEKLQVLTNGNKFVFERL